MSLLTTTVVIATIGSALIGGVFFAFSSFIMPALARIPSAEGIAAMRSINVVVLNRSFLGVFVGTALLSLFVIGLAVANRGTPPAMWYVGGALAYLVGTFLVTGLGNVPLNDRLAAAEADAGPVWEHYLSRWTRLNTIRTFAAVAAAVSFTIGLLHAG